MKHLVYLSFLFALAISPSLGWAGQRVGLGGTQAQQNLARRLALTHEQRLQFHAIAKERKEQTEEVKADASLSASVRRQKLKEISAGAETKIRALLTPVQLEEYDQIKQERREAAQRRRSAGTDAPAGNAPPQ